MKKILTITFGLIIFSLTESLASNYYWVGGTGTWSDYAAHWATSSGGTVFHVTIPSPNDDVYFDANSFSMAGDTIYMDTTLTNCKTMDWSGVVNSPVFSGNPNLDIYGSFVLSPNMIWNCQGSLEFKSSLTGNIINTFNHPLGDVIYNHYANVKFSGSGTWDLQSGIYLQNYITGGSIYIYDGSVLTHGYPLEVYQVNVSGSTSSLLLDTSLVSCVHWNYYASGVLDATNATIDCGTFNGGQNKTYFNVLGSSDVNCSGCTFNDVTCQSISSSLSTYHNVILNYGLEGNNNVYNKATIIGSSVSLEGNQQMDSLIIQTPGAAVEFYYDDTITVNSSLQADGSCSGLTSFSGSDSTTLAFLSMPSGTTTLNYVMLQNIAAMGGAAFIANNSIDAGHVTGFTVNTPAPLNLYWVGGSGYWNDVNHWAISSGGAGGNCVPNQFDNVFFDANSFPSLNDTLYFNSPAFCNSMNWSGVANFPVMTGNLDLKVFGSFILSPNMTWNCEGSLEFKSSQTGNIINTFNHPLGDVIYNHYANVKFSGSGTWDLQSGIYLQNYITGGSIYIYDGSVLTHGYPLEVYQVNVSGSTSSLLLDTSLVSCVHWNYYASGVLDATNATIDCGTFNGGQNKTYFNVLGSSDVNCSGCTFNDVTCQSISSSLSTYHNVILNYGLEGNNNVYNKATIIGSSVSLEGNQQMDSLIIQTPGAAVEFYYDDTITVNSSLQADGSCSGLTSFSGSDSTTLAFLSMPSGTTTLNYVMLQNIAAIGGAAFIANNSIDAGHVTGFTVNTPAPLNLYWVGGSGYWNDVNHWAISSGGAGGNCVPNQFDNVFFDANSFPSLNDTLYFNSPAFCNSMNWSGVANFPVMTGNLDLKVFGSFILSPNMIWNCQGSLEFKSSLTGNIINTFNHPLGDVIYNHYANVKFSGSGTWDLQSGIYLQNYITGGSIYIYDGSVLTHGYPLEVYQVNVSGSTSSLLLDTSLVSCVHWNYYASGVLDATNATIDCGTFNGGQNKTYFNVLGSSDVNCSGCTFNDVTCQSISSSLSTYHNVILNYGLEGNNNVYNKATIIGSSVSLEGNQIADTLILNNPGQQVMLNSSDTFKVNNFLLIQSDPGFPSQIKCSNGTATFWVSADTVCADYLYLENITATGGAVFFAGDHSVDLGGNTGWNWLRCSPLISNVWPGDCNYDLITDNFDLLNIGVAYGDTGYVRPGASLAYTAQPCQDWYYQFINAVNVKHADCDGNGIVDGPDSSAISLNYGLTHPARLGHQEESNSVGPELAFDLPPVIVPGSAVSVPVTLGTSVLPASGVYGIAFTVNYDPAFIQAGTMSVDYGNSWVENSSNHLHLEKDFPVVGKTDIAFTKIDHSDASGYGMIATLNFVASPSADGPFMLSFSHVLVISHNEIEIPVETISSTTWLSVPKNENEIISAVYPNPVTNQSRIVFANPSNELWHLAIRDVTGRIFSEKNTSGNSFIVERKNLNAGVYFYTISDEKNNITTGKIIVQ